MRGRLRLIVGGAILGAVIGAVSVIAIGQAAGKHSPSRNHAPTRGESSLDLRRLVSLGVSAIGLVRQVLEL